MCKSILQKMSNELATNDTGTHVVVVVVVVVDNGNVYGLCKREEGCSLLPRYNCFWFDELQLI